MTLVLASLGSFVEGYCLVLPRRHVVAVRDLTMVEWDDMVSVVESLLPVVQQMYGSYIVAEHGCGTEDRGAACCDHAHLHLIPVPTPRDVLKENVRLGGPGVPLDLSVLPPPHLFPDSPYIWLYSMDTGSWCWPAKRFPRQHVRRVAAAAHGLEAQYNWRRFPFRLTMTATAAKVRLGLLNRDLAVDPPVTRSEHQRCSG